MPYAIQINFKILIRIIGLVFLIITFSLSQNYELVWSDEFDSTGLDPAKWEYQTGTGTSYGLPAGWGNNELQYYTTNNTVIDSGYLKIIAKNEIMGGRDYTSSRIRTIYRGDWKYGRFEFRAKMPVGQGIWPAIWMMPTDNVYGTWAASGEIDIVEYLGHQPDRVYGTIHYGGAWPNNTQAGSSVVDPDTSFHEDFHDFAFEWEEGAMRWYVDGKLYFTRTNWYTTGYSFPAPFDKRFHLILNLAVGGNWPGNPDTSTTFPQEFIIDYVHVYQQISAIESSIDYQPHQFILHQNYPNPFNPNTVISYNLTRAGKVNLKIYDLNGQEIKVLVNDRQTVGSYSVSVNMQGLSTGVYLYQLQYENESICKKMIYMK